MDQNKKVNQCNTLIEKRKKKHNHKLSLLLQKRPDKVQYSFMIKKQKQKTQEARIGRQHPLLIKTLMKSPQVT